MAAAERSAELSGRRFSSISGEVLPCARICPAQAELQRPERALEPRAIRRSEAAPEQRSYVAFDQQANRPTRGSDDDSSRRNELAWGRSAHGEAHRSSHLDVTDNKKIEGRSIIHRSTSRSSSHRATSGRRARSLVQEDGRGKRIRAPDSDVISRPSQEGLRVELKSGSSHVAPGDGSEFTARAIRGIPPGARRPQAAEREGREQRAFGTLACAAVGSEPASERSLTAGSARHGEGKLRSVTSRGYRVRRAN